MRIQLCSLIVLITCMHVSATGYGQTVTLNEKNASLQSLFDKIKEQSGYTFWYNLLHCIIYRNTVYKRSKGAIKIAEWLLQKTNNN